MNPQNQEDTSGPSLSSSQNGDKYCAESCFESEKKIGEGRVQLLPPPMTFDSLGSNLFKEPEEDMWYIMFEMLLQFCIQNNHCNVPVDFNVKLTNGRVLQMGIWLQLQREKRRYGLLSDEKLTILQSLVDSGKLSWENQKPANFTGSIIPTLYSMQMQQPIPFRSSSEQEELLWTAYFEALKRYCEEYGHCNIPKDKEYPLADGTVVKLGAWLELQRIHRSHGDLAPGRLRCFENLMASGKLQWQPQQQSASSSFAEGNSSDSDCPGEAEEENSMDTDPHNGLTRFANSSANKRKREHCSVTSDGKWMMIFEALVKYGDQNGTCNVPYKVFLLYITFRKL